MLIDGVVEEVLTDSNGGKCVEPYKFVTPCKTALNSGWTVDTSPLGDGDHLVEVAVEDASGQVTKSGAIVTIHNAPLNTALPAISGVAKVGESLSASTGQWEGSPSAFSYQWLRCPPSVKSGEEKGCVAIGGATQPGYTAVVADAGARLLAKVTAANTFGSEPALSAPSEVVIARPDGNPAPGEVPQRGQPPQTRLAKHPRKRSAVHMARFTFSADQPGSSFQCKLDKGSFSPCHSPFVRIVKRGTHRFRVRAISAAGVVDPTPATYRWRTS
jgi:hypothetical protein